MAESTLTRKIRELNQKHPGLRANLNAAIRKGKRAHWISSHLHHVYGVRLKEDFIVRYANYRNAFADGEADDAPVEAVVPSAESPAAAESPSSSAQAGSPTQRGGKGKKSQDEGPEATEVTKGMIIHALKRKVAQMLHKAEADPDSDASVFVRAHVLNGLASEELGYEEAAFLRLVEAERKQADLAKMLEHEKFERKAIMKRWQNERRQLRQTMQTARDATKRGLALNHEEIFRQVSAVIGVGQPLAKAPPVPETCWNDTGSA